MAVCFEFYFWPGCLPVKSLNRTEARPLHFDQGTAVNVCGALLTAVVLASAGLSDDALLRSCLALCGAGPAFITGSSCRSASSRASGTPHPLLSGYSCFSAPMTLLDAADGIVILVRGQRLCKSLCRCFCRCCWTS